jgi:hypothetical protein
MPLLLRQGRRGSNRYDWHTVLLAFLNNLANKVRRSTYASTNWVLALCNFFK